MKLIDRTIRDNLIADCISDMIWEMDFKTKEFYVSDAWKDFLGYEREKYHEGVDFWRDVIHPEDLKAVHTSFREHFEKKTSVFSAKYRVRTKDKGYKWVLVRAKAYRNNYDEVVNIAGFHIDIPAEIITSDFQKDKDYLYMSAIRDIDDRLSTERALKEERELNKNIVNLSPNGAFIHDDGRIIYANKKGMDMLKAESMDELHGKDIFDFLSDDFKENGKERLKRVQRGEIVEPAEVLVKGLDGSTLIAEISTAFMPSKSGTLALSYFKDITVMRNIYEENKKLLEQTLEYDKLKTEFFANISHELRTPLNIILSSIQLLNYTYKNCNDKNGQCFNLFNKYIEVMKQNSYRLLKLINNLIDITRIDKGFYNINLRNHNIVEIIEEVSLSVVPYVESRGVEFIFDTDFEEKIIACDEDKIERILLNLLSNAIKFTSSGGKIKVNLGEQGGKLIISVKDTGRGIPEDKLDLIFERFRQVDEVLTKRAEGSGIGLSLVKALVAAHKGEIKVRSEVGKGSEFLVELPLTVMEDECASDVFTNIPSLEQNKVERINIELADIDV